ncbi:hypothetical protein AMK16_26310 [Streptomyces sp. CB00455]|nr:hypothetical protein AMK16_26310 [Streptomyces sp. CB00455]
MHIVDGILSRSTIGGAEPSGSGSLPTGWATPSRTFGVAGIHLLVAMALIGGGLHAVAARCPDTVVEYQPTE